MLQNVQQSLHAHGRERKPRECEELLFETERVGLEHFRCRLRHARDAQNGHPNFCVQNDTNGQDVTQKGIFVPLLHCYFPFPGRDNGFPNAL